MKELLDLNSKDINAVSITTKYCVDQATHDLHVQKCIKTGYPPIPVAQPNEIKDGPIAVICSGKTLREE